MDRISDVDLNNYYARDYYGPGTNYFDGPYTEDDLVDVLNCEEDDYE